MFCAFHFLITQKRRDAKRVTTTYMNAKCETRSAHNLMDQVVDRLSLTLRFWYLIHPTKPQTMLSMPVGITPSPPELMVKPTVTPILGPLPLVIYGATTFQ